MEGRPISVPAISTGVADVIGAETGADMTVFATAEHLASWSGTCPGSNESAGRVKSTHTRPRNPYLKGALGVAAMSAARSRGTYFAAKYRRIAARRGPTKAIVATEHACSSPSGTCSAPGSYTPTPVATSTPASTPTRPRPAPSTSSARWATRSPSNPSPSPCRCRGIFASVLT
jgi:transposase